MPWKLYREGRGRKKVERRRGKTGGCLLCLCVKRLIECKRENDEKEGEGATI